MSRGLFSNSRDFGLSSDDDEDSGGALIRDGHARGASSNRLVNSSSSPAHQGYNRGQKPGGPTRSSGKNQSSRHSHGSSRHAYSTQNSVSLADFDKEFVDIDDDDDDNDEDNDRVRRKGGRGGGGGGGHRRNFGRGGSRSRLGGAVDWTSEVTKLLLTSSKWKLAMVGLVLGLLCAVAHQSYLWVTSERSSSDNLLKCTADGQEPCLSPSQLKPALLLADTVRHHVHKRAGQFACGVKGITSRDVTLEELQSNLFPEHELNSEEVMNMLTLMEHNPQWGIRWLDETKESISNLRFPSPNDLLSSTSPSRSVSCLLRQGVSAMWSQMKMIIMIVVGVVVLVAMVRWYVQSKETEMRNVYMMVDRILDVMKKHHENTRRDSTLLPYLAIIHVRDMLIPPSERKHKVKIWAKACQWLAEHESRVRIENQRIAGEEFEVWRWIQVDPPQTETPWLTTAGGQRGGGGAGGGGVGGPGGPQARGGSASGSSSSSGGTSGRRQQESTDLGGAKKPRGLGEWRGTAFEDYPPGIDVKVAPPAGSPSQFIRLKNMFEATRYMDDEMAKEIENSVLERCSPHGDVVHVYIDRRSPFGCVYLKMDSLHSAQGAYKALHGGWYRGKLVTAKYIPEVKYYKWFPASATARVALTPSA